MSDLHDLTGLPRSPRYVRRLARELGVQPVRPQVDDRRIVDLLVAAHHWRAGDDGELLVQRRDRIGPGYDWTPWTAAEAARWAIENRVGVPAGADVDDDDDVSPLRDTDTAERFHRLVAEQVRATLLRPAWPTKTPAQAFARRLAAGIELHAGQDGVLRWRLAVVSPVTGGIGRPAERVAGPSLPPAGLLSRIRRSRPVDPDLQVADGPSLDAHARHVGLLEPAAPVPAPGWNAVIAELRNLAGAAG